MAEYEAMKAPTEDGRLELMRRFLEVDREVDDLREQYGSVEHRLDKASHMREDLRQQLINSLTENVSAAIDRPMRAGY